MYALDDISLYTDPIDLYIPSTTNITCPGFNDTACFYGNINSITVGENNQNFSSIDGVLFNKAGTTLILYPSGNSATSYTIPNSSNS